MNIVSVIIAVVIFSAGVIFSFNESRVGIKEDKVKGVVASEIPLISTPVIVEIKTPLPSVDVEEIIKPSVTAASTPIGNQDDISSISAGYIYPNSNVSQNLGSLLKLTSADNVDAITNWYKEKIKAQGMNVTSFVVTKTNNNVFNKLVGADGKRQVRVEIKKEANASFVEIVIELKS